MKKFLSLLVVAAICFIFVGECSAERICVIPKSFQGEDLCIETSEIRIVRLQDSHNGEPQYGFLVPTERYNPERDEITEYNFHNFVFFKTFDGKWCAANISKESASMEKIKIGSAMVIDPNEKIQNYRLAIFKAGSKYVDVDSIGNTEARYSSEGNGGTIAFFSEG